MAEIVFFCIPAHGHVNPTLAVVGELVRRGHHVRYYCYEQMREKITAAGAEFVPCDGYDLQMGLSEKDNDRIPTDLAYAVDLIVNMTLAMDRDLCREMEERRPDCIVGDSMAYWGKLIAWKCGIPFVSSTTTFAFNRYSSKIMKQSFGELFSFLLAQPRINRSLKRLRERGYPVKNVLSILQNDNETDTVVYTSKQFQPCAETFSEKYSFVGPLLRTAEQTMEKGDCPTVYISLGTVINKRENFYRSCIEALRDCNLRVIMAVGERTDLASLGELPANITVERFADQMAVLSVADVFLTHCGMNSVNEGLFYEVPLLLYPQTKEQEGVANRVEALGAGLRLTSESPAEIRRAVETILSEPSYRENAVKIADSFRASGGANEAADKILRLTSD